MSASRRASISWPAALPLALALLLIAGAVALLSSGAARNPDANLAARAGSEGRHRAGAKTPQGAGVPGSGGSAGSPSPKAVEVKPVTETVMVGEGLRSYQVFAPPPASGRVPALVVLDGGDATVETEEARDGLIAYADESKALVVYPLNDGQSWNAGSCCGPALAQGIDDTGFIDVLVHILEAQPGVRDVALIGYSNGGRLAYDVVCSDPTLVHAFVVIAAVPAVTCPGGAPVSLLDIDSANDQFVSFDATSPPHNDGPFKETTVVDEVAAWRLRDGCSSGSTMLTSGDAQLDLWAPCTNSTSVELADYTQPDGHTWPQGGPGTPPAAQLLWSFLTNPPGHPQAPGKPGVA